MTSQAIGLYPDRHKSRQMSELMRLRASDLRELAEKMRVVLAYDPAMTIRANEVAVRRMRLMNGRRSAVTPRSIDFVDEYLVDLNATQAAIRAGYSEKTAYSIGQRLLKNVEVQNDCQSHGRKIKTHRDNARSRADRHRANQARCDAKGVRQNGNEAMINHTSALKACELQGRHLQMWNDKVALTIETTTDEELHARIADLARKAGITSAAG